MRLTNERFAEQLGVSVRAVAKWHAQPDLTPSPILQQVLDTVLQRCDATTLERFNAITADLTGSAGSGASIGGVQLPPGFSAALDWIDDHADWPLGTAERYVHERLTKTAVMHHKRSGDHDAVPRGELAEAVTALYSVTGGMHFYDALVDDRPVQTSVLTQDSWLDLALPLGGESERFTVDYETSLPPAQLSAEQANAAVERIAEIVAGGARVFNAQLYALLDLSVQPDGMSGSFGLTEFLPYALTTDLLEDELSRTVAKKPRDFGRHQLPLRTAELPTVDAALDFRSRACVGGALALVAIARPAGRGGRPADYLLLVQERSTQVVNGTRRLSVVPKAFHQPLGDYSEDAAISATLEREFEEELLGRPELEVIASGSFVDPRHHGRLSPPMRQLTDGPADSWTAECTGIGVNLASGNYEFAGLIAIHDEQWWNHYGGDLRGNWEADGVRRYSSQNHDGIARLIMDDRWSNEGLFAFLQGLRRLAEIAPDRVTAPIIAKGPHIT